MASDGARADERGIVITCPNCGQKNRIPFTHAGQAGTCGKCQAALPALSAPVELGSVAQFDALTRQSPSPVVVDYWAPWCGPCKAVAPELAKVAVKRAGQWVVAKVNTEALPQLAQRYGIAAIPTMAVFAHGQEVGRTSGARPASQIEAFVQDAVKS